MVRSVLVLLLLSTQVPATSATIEGTIQKFGTTDVVPDSAVELALTNSDKRYAVSADKAGHFAFHNILPGEYRIAATRPGFVRGEYGQRGLRGAGATVTVRAGLNLTGVTIGLVQTGAISGRISNRNGLSLENAQVRALRFIYKDGRRTLAMVRSTVTNDLGEYRLFWLPPADYLIEATPLAAVASNQIRAYEPYGAISISSVSAPTGKPIRTPNDEASIPFFFPGVTDPGSASRIRIDAGANIGGINITVRALPVRNIFGVAVNLPQSGAIPNPSPRVRLQPRSAVAIENEGMLTSIDLASGAFQFRDVLPGTYDLYASAGNLHGHVAMEVTNGDVDGVRIPMLPDAEINIMVSIEGRASSANDADIGRLRIQLTPDGPGPARRQQTGVFAARGVKLGEENRIQVDQLPAGAYVQSIRLGDFDVLTNGLRMERTPDIPIQMVIGLRGGVVRGNLLRDAVAPNSAATVVLVPETHRERGDLYRKVESDAEGRFRIDGIAPGNYKVYAWVDIDEGAWRDSEIMSRVEDRGVAVRVEENSDQLIPVRVIP